ncbi:hypothetical protein TUBRATIS_16460 [Tubulinosema ratisbonensis]|uniref:Phosphoribulokinase/uridine kinase domain-containing protein n=1 Tax=Tubulinosema ratisbonensis TaxID=291195 RepID=A0A437AL03_9MICR|nr:hypothetical protein TUBRATIS_16460 [Tubulinosema ratisbonensis]
MTSSEMETNLLDIITSKLNTNKKIKVIAIQGPSTSGKTTLSFALQVLLKLANKSCYVLNLDDFFQTKPQNDEFYDYENPSIIRWDKVFHLLKSFDEEREVLEIFKFKFKNSLSSGPIYIDNPKPEYLIVEGLHSHYLFSDEFFCFKEVKFNKSLEQIDFDVAFKKNPMNYQNFSVLKIGLTIGKNEMIEIRSKRDAKERSFDDETIRKQLEYVWQGTEKWIYNYKKTKPDIIIENGTFNFECLNLLKMCFIKYWVQYEGLNMNIFNLSPFKVPEFTDCEKNT